MPIYEYVCKRCQDCFETLVRGAAKPECPSCKSKSLEKQFSVFGVSTKSESTMGCAPGAGPCGSCDNPMGPGACGMS